MYLCSALSASKILLSALQIYSKIFKFYLKSLIEMFFKSNKIEMQQVLSSVLLLGLDFFLNRTAPYVCILFSYKLYNDQLYL
jgi:hypothetical protein